MSESSVGFQSPAALTWHCAAAGSEMTSLDTFDATVAQGH